MDFEALVRHSMDIIAVIDSDTRLLYANPAAERILGLTTGGQVSRFMRERVHPDDANWVLDRLGSIMGGAPSGIPVSFRVRAVDGGWRTLQVVGSSRVDDPSVQGVVLNARDITELTSTAQAVERGLECTIQTLASIVELRDPYTAGHQHRVAVVAGALAENLGLPPQVAQGVRIAATLHDIGKIAIPTDILNKPGQLSPLELALIRTHSQIGHDLLGDIEFPWPVAQMVLEHHERLDGSGYPVGSHGDEISLGSRILAVADVVEAMSSPRPYRPGRGIESALNEIKDGAGVRYDPAVGAACLALFEEDGFEAALWAEPTRRRALTGG